MRASLRGNSWRLLLAAAMLLAVLCLVASAPAKDLEEKLDATQGKLSHVRESQSALAATIAEQNREIDSMIGEVSALRQQQAAVEAELAEKQSELDAATAKLEKDQQHLAVVRERLQRALAVLRERLVAIYEAGSPDVVNAIIESASWDEVAAQTEYLNRIQSYDDSVVERVKTLRDEERWPDGRSPYGLPKVKVVKVVIKKVKKAKEEEKAAEGEAAAAPAADKK